MESRSRHKIAVAVPYNLGLTVNVLRRLSTNVVDILTSEGTYYRALQDRRQIVIVRVDQRCPNALDVELEGEAFDRRGVLALVRKTLGTDRDVTTFRRAAARIAWLQAITRRMSGVRPPRYPSLWEACVNAIIFQQLSLHAASTILRRLIIELSEPLEHKGVTLRIFPGIDRFMGIRDGTLRAAGISATKIATLRRVAEAIASDTINEERLEGCSSLQAGNVLRGIKGIGPWSAALILLRGLGRLDVFPQDDSSVVHNLEFIAGSKHIDVDKLLSALGSQRGMLYFHLLLARLEARGDLGLGSS